MRILPVFYLAPRQHFTGAVLTAEIASDENTRTHQVIFSPGARTNWHKHSEGQVIKVTIGKAWLAVVEGDRIIKKELKAGESYEFQPNQKHWHGATPDGLMEHLATPKGITVWMEPVDDNDYMSK